MGSVPFSVEEKDEPRKDTRKGAPAEVLSSHAHERPEFHCSDAVT
jgi:hypothetical protein